MTDYNLKTALRNRLKVRESNPYMNWFGLNRVKIGHEHHILESVHGKKLNDFFLVDKSAEAHNKIHYDKIPQSEEDFLTDFLTSLDNLLDYTQWIESELKRRK